MLPGQANVKCISRNVQRKWKGRRDSDHITHRVAIGIWKYDLNVNRRAKSPLYIVVKETFKNYNRGGKWNKEGMQAASQIYWRLITGAKNRHWRPWRDDSNHVSLKSQRPRAPRRRDDLRLWVRQILTRQSRLLAAALTDVIHSPWNWSCGMSYQQAQTVVLTVGQLTETLIISKTLSFDPCRKDASRLDVCLLSRVKIWTEAFVRERMQFVSHST